MPLAQVDFSAVGKQAFKAPSVAQRALEGKVSVDNLAHAQDNLLSIDRRWEFQIIQHGADLLSEGRLLAQNTLEMGGLDLVNEVVEGGLALLAQGFLGAAPAQILQNGAVGFALLVDAVFQADPKQAFIEIVIRISFKIIDKVLELGVIVIFTDCAENVVPVQLGLSGGVVDFKIRLKGVVFGGIPDDVDRPFLLFALVFHCQWLKIFDRSRFSGMRRRMTSSTSSRSKSSKDLLVIPIWRAWCAVRPFSIR